MLVLHPGSQCDVCLEHYTSDSSEHSPHTIPCGHIFCKSCLGTFDPPNCPLCRKPFLSVRIKRLHVDRLDPDEAKQTDYLNRLILAWGEISDEELVLLLEPIQNWLERKDSDKCKVLRKAAIILSKFQRLKSKRLDDQRMIKRLNNRIADDDREKASQNESQKTVESSLRQEIGDLKMTIQLKDGELKRLKASIDDSSSSAEIQTLKKKISEYEGVVRQLKPLTTKQEERIRSLRRELEYYTNLSSSLQSNPLPQPPTPFSYEHLPYLSQALTYKNRPVSFVTTHENAYMNGYTNDSSHSPRTEQIPKKNKGKEREPGSSYDLSSASSTACDSTMRLTVVNPLFTSQNLINSILPSEQVLRGVSPGRRVVPTSTVKPAVPAKYDPKLVSEVRPDQPALPTPPNPHISFYNGSVGKQGQTALDLLPVREPVNRRMNPARDFVDPYALTAAYAAEYTAGYGTGYHLAEYTPGEAARVIVHRPTGVASGSAVAYINSGVSEGCDKEREQEGERDRNGQKGLDNMNKLNRTLSEVGATLTARSNPPITGSSFSQVSPIGGAGHHRNSPLHSSLSPDSWSQKTQIAGYPTETELFSHGSLGMIEDGSLTRGVPQNIPGPGLPSTLYGTINSHNTTTSSSTTMPWHHTNLPGQLAQPVPVPATTISAAVTTAESPSTGATAAHLVSDKGSLRTAPSWGTINTHSIPLLDWQSTGSSLNLNLRGFAHGAGVTARSTDVDLENCEPHIPESMIVSHRTGDATAGVNRIEADDGNGFPVLRESDEEKTPVSRSTRTLAPVPDSGATNEDGVRPESDFYDVASLQMSSGHRQREQDGSDQDRDRGRDRNSGDRDRNSKRTRSHDKTGKHPLIASLVPTYIGEGGISRYAQMASAFQHATGGHQPRSSQTQSLYSKQRQMDQLWHDNGAQAPPSSSYTQPSFSPSSLSLPQIQSHTTTQPQPRAYSQSHSRHLDHQSSVSTASLVVEPQHKGLQSAAPNTAPLHAPSDWSEIGYYNDSLSTSHSRPQYNTYPSTQLSNGGSQSSLASPTLFSSNSGTNALGLDGLNEPRPLHITAPTPVMLSASFLKSFSYDNFS